MYLILNHETKYAKIHFSEDDMWQDYCSFKAVRDQLVFEIIDGNVTNITGDVLDSYFLTFPDRVY